MSVLAVPNVLSAKLQALRNDRRPPEKIREMFPRNQNSRCLAVTEPALGGFQHIHWLASRVDESRWAHVCGALAVDSQADSLVSNAVRNSC